MTIVLVTAIRRPTRLGSPRRRPRAHGRRSALAAGFRRPSAEVFPATHLAYRDWLEDELERIDGPVDLVGHDWGGGHVMNVVMHRPELVAAGPATRWDCSTPTMCGMTWHRSGRPKAMASNWWTPCSAGRSRAARNSYGAWHSTGHRDHDRGGPRSGDGPGDPGALPLGQPAGDGRGGPRVGERRGTTGSIAACHRGPVHRPDDNRRRAADRAGAQTAVLDQLGHWWMVQDPAAGAEALTDFWATLG